MTFLYLTICLLGVSPVEDGCREMRGVEQYPTPIGCVVDAMRIAATWPVYNHYTRLANWRCGPREEKS